MTKEIKPKYEWVNEDGASDITPVKRRLNKTMEITESFSMYDTLRYVMNMEKGVEDKLAEIEAMRTMIKAYRDEIELIEKELGVTKLEEKWNKELHEKLKAEDEAEKALAIESDEE